MTLDEFLSKAYPRNAYVTFPGMARLYVRQGGYLINSEIREDTIQIASVESSSPGNGAFRKLIEYLTENHPDSTIVVECVLVDRMAEILEHMGFDQINLSSGRHFALLSS